MTRKTTGTLVQGRIANSVTTAVTRSEGVTSYINVRGSLLEARESGLKGFSELPRTDNKSDNEVIK